MPSDVTTRAMPRSMVAVEATRPRPKRWSWTHYLAFAAVPWGLWQGWTLVAWLADGPHGITTFQDTNSLNWYAAKATELLTLAISIAVTAFLVWEFRRDRPRFWFDVSFSTAMFLTFWNDFGLNFFNPIFTISSNFININNPLGYMPFIPNPDAGRAPDAIWIWFCDGFGYLGMAILAAYYVRWCRRRWPGISDVKLVAMICLLGIPFDLVIEGIAVALGLWHYATPFAIPFGQYRLLLIEPIAAGTFFGLIAALRSVRDDQGRTFLERGLDRHTPRARMAITALALYSAGQFITWGPGTPWVYFPYAKWDKVPAYVVNDLCDAPGVTRTRYGPCPGSPGYRMPGRASSVPGTSP